MPDNEPITFASTGKKTREQQTWGSVEVLTSGPGFQARRLTLKPLKALSLQWHRHRDEHWVIARGTAKVTVDNSEYTLGRGQSVNIPRTVQHRIENISSVDPLEVIELQTGDYLADDDVVRIEEESDPANQQPE